MQDPEKKFWRIFWKVEIGKFTSHRELCVKEVSKVTIANDIVGNIVGNDRPLIEENIGETGGNLNLQGHVPTVRRYIRDFKMLVSQTLPFRFSIRVLNVKRLVFLESFISNFIALNFVLCHVLMLKLLRSLGE